MVVMTLCPNCRTIQKAGTICPLCKCPVAPPPDPRPVDLKPRSGDCLCQLTLRGDER